VIHTTNPDKLHVERLWDLYTWPEWSLPMRGMTINKLLAYRTQPAYVSDEERTRRQPTRAWDYGRIRFFYEQLLAGEALDAIEVDNVCAHRRIYPEPIVLGWTSSAGSGASLGCADHPCELRRACRSAAVPHRRAKDVPHNMNVPLKTNASNHDYSVVTQE